MPAEEPAGATALSPFTGLERRHWAALADRLLLALRPWASPDHARIALPGPPSGSGRRSDELEAFARSFLLVAFRLRGESGRDPHDLAGWYAAGLAAGTDPASPTAWPRPDVLQQAKVEAASIALGLHLTRPWIWDRLPERDREHVIGWLAGVIGRRYPPINWVWFQLVVEAFLRSVGGPWSASDVAGGLAVHSSLYRGGGWYSDGPERSYDHYVGWALHLYPLLWAELAADLCPPAEQAQWRDRLADYLDDAVCLVGADGAPLLQGRSLIYRFAAAAPFWVGAATGATRLSPGVLRRTCSGMLRHFTARGVPDDHDLLTLGWHREWPAMAQAYSGPGSPYWAVKGMLGLALPARHPVWTAVEEPLPVERGDLVRAVDVPGWIVSATRADGLVRVLNHGTDHSLPGDPRADAPLYARLGYSTATVPPLVGDAVAHPGDNSVLLVHPRWGATHRNGFERLSCRVDGAEGIAASRARAHWVQFDGDDGRDHGSGRSGTPRRGPWITVGSVLRGGTEVRVARVDGEIPAEVTLELSGWPLSSDAGPAREVDGRSCVVRAGELVSSVQGLAGFDRATVRDADDVTPLGVRTAVPLLQTRGAPQPGHVYAAVVALHGSDVTGPGMVAVDARPDAAGGHTVTVHWDDGHTSSLPLPPPPP